MSYEELLVKNTNQQKKIASLEEQLSQQQAKFKTLEEQYRQLIRIINGFKSERLVRTDIPDNQTSLFAQEQQRQEQEQKQEEIITYNRKKSKHQGRNKLPEHLPVKEVIIEPEEETEGLVKIGEEVTETLEYTPASLIKRRTIRPKYAKPNGQGIVIAELPSRPIAKCIAEASLLAYILVSKYVDHLPLYRQIQRFKREYGWDAPQSTLCDWVNHCCKLLDPLYNKLKQKILSSDYIQADESPLKVLDKNKPRTTHQGYQWVYHSPMDHLVLFNYRKGRGQHGPKEILENYTGYLQCDGYKVYDVIGKQKDITLVGCLAHARRKFHEAQDNDAKRAKHVLELIAKIYHLDKQINQNYPQDYSAIKTERQAKLQPLFKQIKDWIETESYKVLPQSNIAKAMRYFLQQYHKLEAVLLDGRLKLDNNLTENKIRPLALGRKNYLFAGSHKAAQNTAMIYSFFMSCKANNVNPLIWLTNVLEKIPEYKIQELEQLLPDQWKNDNM